MPGDEQGPFFKEGCNLWAYNDRYSGRIFNEQRLSITRPHDYQYCSKDNIYGYKINGKDKQIKCEYQQWAVSPQVRSTL